MNSTKERGGQEMSQKILLSLMLSMVLLITLTMVIMSIQAVERDQPLIIVNVKVVRKPEGISATTPKRMIMLTEEVVEKVITELKSKFGESFFKEHFVLKDIIEKSSIPDVMFINFEYTSNGYKVNMSVAVNTWWRSERAYQIIHEFSNIIHSPQEIRVTREKAENIAAEEKLPQPYTSRLEVRDGRIVWVMTSQNFEKYPIGDLVRLVIDAETGEVLARIPRPPFLFLKGKGNEVIILDNGPQSFQADKYSVMSGSESLNSENFSAVQNVSSSSIYILGVYDWVEPPDKLLLGQDQPFEAWGCNDDTETHRLYFKFFLTAPDGQTASDESDHLDIDPGYCLVWHLTVLGSWAKDHGVGISNFRFELWEDIPWWPDKKHDEYSDEYWTIFPKPFESDVYYGDNQWHHPSHEKIIKTALQAAAGKTNPRDAADALKSYVYNTITYDSNYYERNSDLEVLSQRRGVCVDFANLYIGLARALNIPTRHVVGWTYGSGCSVPAYKTNNVCGAYCPYVYVCWGHAWAESYYYGDWHHVDPTWNKIQDPRAWKGLRGAEHIHASAYTRLDDPYQQNCNWAYDAETLSNGHIDVTVYTDGGYDDFYYCPKDMDGDGNCDNLDPDNDDDGIMDDSDKCPCTWGHACNDGCPDNTPPGKPSPTCEGGGDWINDNTPTITWDHVSDEGCGVYGYEYAIDQTDSWTDIGYTNSFQTPPLSDGEHTIYVRAYDGAGNRGEYGSCTVKVDTTKPNNPTSIWSNPPKDQWTTQTSVTFYWSGASDTYSGVKGYHYLVDKHPDTSVDSSDPFTSATSVSKTLSDGEWYLHIRAVDNAGNLASSTKHYGPIKIDTTPPYMDEGESLKINNDAEYTNSKTVTIHFEAADLGSGIKRYYLRNGDGDWTLIEELPSPQEIYEDTHSWTLSPGDGEKCVFIDIQDDLGNSWWPNPPSEVLPYLYDCIKLDTTPPPAPSPASPPDGSQFIEYRVTLQWQAVTDPSPGEVDHYIVEVDTTSSFNSPNKKTYTTSSTSIMTDALNTGIWYWRVRAKDKAGNLGSWSEVRSFRIIGNPDSDDKRELTIWRPSNGRWYILTSQTNYDYKKAFIRQWGAGTLNDIALLGFMDSDNMEDLVIWRPGNGRWYILESSTNYDYSQAFVKQWGSGALNDVPLLGDIDGDNLNDLVIWRPGNGRWYILKSSAGYSYPEAFIKQWGSGALNDKPLLGDIDGDGKDDLVIWRPSNGRWYILKSSTGYDYSKAFIKQWGSGALNDIPLLGDIDGDGKDDLIIWRPGNGRWYILKSSTNYDYGSAFIKQWGSGALNDIPLVGDIDGDGKDDLIIWRPGNGRWYILKSSENYDYSKAFVKQWGSGALNDVPL